MLHAREVGVGTSEGRVALPPESDSAVNALRSTRSGVRPIIAAFGHHEKGRWGTMWRLLLTFSLAGMVALAGALSARADAVYHSQHVALSPTGGAPLRSGFVENIHADGPNVYAHEQYFVNGAEPDTTYQVVLMIFPLDTTCSSSSITIPTALIATNAAGNGSADHVFTPADADGLRGLTVGGMWLLMKGNTVVYATSCATIHLD